MSSRLVASGIALAVSSSILAGCGSSDGPAPSPAPSPPPPAPSPPGPPTTTTVTTTTGCEPGNALDQCAKCDYCNKAADCEALGHAGCSHTQCTWYEDSSSSHGGMCKSPHGTTTPTTTPSTGCVPQTVTDACFTTGTYASSEESCMALGPIGCQHQFCHYYALANGTKHCGSMSSTTTDGPCVPHTGTDRCYTTCFSYCTSKAQCDQLGSFGCGGTPCVWVNASSTCQSQNQSFVDDDDFFVEVV